jgi:F-type H+-transporting ATPase subunit alpha
MVATLNQPQYQPWPMEEQVVALWAGNEGYLDKIPTGQVPRFQDELREHLRAQRERYETIRETGELSEETEEQLRSEVERFANSFSVEEEGALVS